MHDIIDTHLRDSHDLVFQLTWGDAPFVPTADWFLQSTIKRRILDPDTAAVVQKATLGGGITVSGSEATVHLLSIDTDILLHGIYWIDIRAFNTITGEAHTVVEPEQIELKFIITREPRSSIPIHVIEPPFPGTGPPGPVGPQGPVGPAGPAGAGVDEYVDLLDKATVDLPTVNTPLALALIDKANLSVGNTFNGDQFFNGALKITTDPGTTGLTVDANQLIQGDLTAKGVSTFGTSPATGHLFSYGAVSFFSSLAVSGHTTLDGGVTVGPGGYNQGAGSVTLVDPALTNWKNALGITGTGGVGDQLDGKADIAGDSFTGSVTFQAGLVVNADQPITFDLGGSILAPSTNDHLEINGASYIDFKIGGAQEMRLTASGLTIEYDLVVTGIASFTGGATFTADAQFADGTSLYFGSTDAFFYIGPNFIPGSTTGGGINTTTGEVLFGLVAATEVNANITTASLQVDGVSTYGAFATFTYDPAALTAHQTTLGITGINSSLALKANKANETHTGTTKIGFIECSSIFGGPTKVLNLGSNNIGRWTVDTTGNFLAVADATYDIGKSGAQRPRHLYLGGNAYGASADFSGPCAFGDPSGLYVNTIRGPLQINGATTLGAGTMDATAVKGIFSHTGPSVNLTTPSVWRTAIDVAVAIPFSTANPGTINLYSGSSMSNQVIEANNTTPINLQVGDVGSLKIGDVWEVCQTGTGVCTVLATSTTAGQTITLQFPPGGGPKTSGQFSTIFIRCRDKTSTTATLLVTGGVP